MSTFPGHAPSPRIQPSRLSVTPNETPPRIAAPALPRVDRRSSPPVLCPIRPSPPREPRRASPFVKHIDGVDLIDLILPLTLTDALPVDLGAHILYDLAAHGRLRKHGCCVVVSRLEAEFTDHLQDWGTRFLRAAQGSAARTNSQRTQHQPDDAIHRPKKRQDLEKDGAPSVRHGMT